MADSKSIIEKQKEQLQRYEKRLKDVVTAYKGLTKEKEALEASLKVLAAERNPKSASEKNAADQKQLKTLSESLAVLSAEKSRMEANFQADKKKLRQEIELLQSNIRSLSSSEQQLKYENEGLKSKLTVEKQDRLQEQENLHVIIQEKQNQYEERVALLEAKLTELSISVGEYDRLRNADQKSIQLLKEQITELESRAQQSSDNDSTKHESASSDSQSSNPKYDADLHAPCREQYENVLRELEHLKQMQTLHSLRENRPDEASAEMDKLQFHNRSLQDRVSSLNKKIGHYENEIHSLRQSKKQIVEREREKYSSELTALRRHQDSQITELEDQIRQLRERSLKILEEKDVEIGKLRGALKNLSPTSVLVGELSQSFESNSSFEPSASSEGVPQLFHFSQESARNAVEATMLRKQNFKLESDVRDLNRKLTSLELAMESETKNLQHEIERLTLGQSREGANLEYLKNVVLRYLTSDDESSKRHMLSAICTVLRFSKDESRAVNKIYKKK